MRISPLVLGFVAAFTVTAAPTAEVVETPGVSTLPAPLTMEAIFHALKESFRLDALRTDAANAAKGTSVTSSETLSNSTNLEKRQWTSGWHCDYLQGGHGFGAMKRQQEMFGKLFGRGSVWLNGRSCKISRCYYSWFAICNFATYQWKEVDYARDRVWEADPGNQDVCFNWTSLSSYQTYIWGSDPKYSGFLGTSNDVRYC